MSTRIDKPPEPGPIERVLDRWWYPLWDWAPGWVWELGEAVKNLIAVGLALLAPVVLWVIWWGIHWLFVETLDLVAGR